MRSKRVSEIYFREAGIQNVVETSIQDECPNECPKCVPGRYVFLWVVLTKDIFGLRGCFGKVSAGVARRFSRPAIENVTSKSQPQETRLKSVLRCGLKEASRARWRLLHRYEGFFFESWGWSSAGVYAGRTRAYAQGIRRVIHRVSATLVKP